LTACRLGIFAALYSSQVVSQSHVDGVPQREQKHLVARRSVWDACHNRSVLTCGGGSEAEAGDGHKDCARKARYICKQKADGVIHCLLLMFPEFLRAKLFVDTELDRLPRLTRPPKVFDRGYNEDCADHASQNREHRH
jgi:hypothetical protein